MPDTRLNDKPIVRSMPSDFTTRADGNDLIVEGYFVVFNSPYHIFDNYVEEVDPHAFDNCDMSDVRALINHDSRLVLGRNTVDTLTLRVDSIGLWASIKINSADSDAVNLHSRVQRGDVNQASFGFDEALGGVVYEDKPDGRVLRKIMQISKLWEVSVCTFPAYEATSVMARSKTSHDLRAEAVEQKKELLKRRFKHA